MALTKVQSDMAGGGPAFLAYASGSQTVSANTPTKVQINTAVFDTNSNFNTSTYRFTPTVAGYYQISGSIYWGTNSVRTMTLIYKNGAGYLLGNSIAGDSGGYAAGVVSGLVYLNGSTDYVELYLSPASNAVTTVVGTAPYFTWFSGSLVRSA